MYRTGEIAVDIEHDLGDMNKRAVGTQDKV